MFFHYNFNIYFIEKENKISNKFDAIYGNFYWKFLMETFHRSFLWNPLSWKIHDALRLNNSLTMPHKP
jgi:hypothetical protein